MDDSLDDVRFGTPTSAEKAELALTSRRRTLMELPSPVVRKLTLPPSAAARKECGPLANPSTAGLARIEFFRALLADRAAILSGAAPQISLEHCPGFDPGAAALPHDEKFNRSALAARCIKTLWRHHPGPQRPGHPPCSRQLGPR